ncbi:MAG: hypothetical protein J0L97_01695 [Alphaproteobacteria bacterium]|nr:hypothetical protein [Alphaproteobacteria bacterium]
MRYTADLHVHSKYAYACSSQGDIDHLAWWGAVKGLQVVATGDFTHPAWRAELKEKLVPAEPGLFQVRPDLASEILATLPPACGELPRFILSVEVSTIYRKGDKTRKIHHLIYVPDMASMDRVVASLARLGNLNADGRPILGLDSRDLLEITLASSPDAFLIPAHIWTPWFAVLGSKSGFDAVDDCYGDLAHHIFAVETGLSSDPAMNWRVASLDRFRLTSSSDAHSPNKLAREATVFETELSYFALKKALETGIGYAGTMEFFPEEGKYHMDGHRDCGICLNPEETRAHGGRCPACGKPVTIGVMHRVAALASRNETDAVSRPPATAGHVQNLVPLPEILSEIVGAGVVSKKVQTGYERVVGSLGSELDVLNLVPVEDIAHGDYGAVDASLLAESVRRLRAGDVIRRAGYDGEYGVIRMFDAAELQHVQKRKKRLAAL